MKELSKDSGVELDEEDDELSEHFDLPVSPRSSEDLLPWDAFCEGCCCGTSEWSKGRRMGDPLRVNDPPFKAAIETAAGIEEGRDCGADSGESVMFTLKSSPDDDVEEALSISARGTGIGSSSPLSVMRTARRGSGRGANRIRRFAEACNIEDDESK